MEEWGHLAVLRAVLEPRAEVARMFYLAVFSLRLWACPLTIWSHHRGIRKNNSVVLDLDNEQEVLGHTLSFQVAAGTRMEMTDVLWI